MNAYQKRQKQKKRNGIFRKWHRRLGFVASLFLLNLAITGILLNHYESLSLDKNYVTSDWILDLYGVSSPRAARCFEAESISVCQLGRFIYLDQQFWQESEHDLLNLVTTPDAIVAATRANLYLLNREGQLIEDIALEESLAQSISAVGWSGEALVVKAKSQHWRLDFDLVEWTPTTAERLTLPQLAPPSATRLAQLQSDYRQRQITHLKLVQDLHSGRILMLPGQLVNDIAAIILILLAVSGFITWQRRLKKTRDES